MQSIILWARQFCAQKCAVCSFGNAYLCCHLSLNHKRASSFDRALVWASSWQASTCIRSTVADGSFFCSESPVSSSQNCGPDVPNQGSVDPIKIKTIMVALVLMKDQQLLSIIFNSSTSLCCSLWTRWCIPLLATGIMGHATEASSCYPVFRSTRSDTTGRHDSECGRSGYFRYVTPWQTGVTAVNTRVLPSKMSSMLTCCNLFLLTNVSEEFLVPWPAGRKNMSSWTVSFAVD